MTFFAFLEKADVTGAKRPKGEDRGPEGHVEGAEKPLATPPGDRSLQLRHNIEVHLPATKDIEVYNAIFKALKENLLD